MNRLKISGRVPIPGGVAPTLQILTLSGSSFVEGSVEDVVIGTFNNTTATSVLALSSADTHIKIVGTTLKVGPTTSVAGASLSPSVVETLSGAIGNPKTSGPFSLTVTAASPSGFGNDGTGTRPGGAVDVTPATVWTAIRDASPGAIFYLAPGNYTDFDGLTFSKGTGAGVTLYGQNGVTCNNIFLDSCVGLHFKYVTVNANPAPVGKSGIQTNACDNCSFDHVDVIGGSPATFNTDTPPAVTNRSTGAFFRVSTNITITNFFMSKIGNAVVTSNDNGGGTTAPCHDILIRHGWCEKYQENCLFFYHTDNVHVDGVRMREYDYTTGGHADLCQIDGVHKVGAGIFDAETGRSCGLIIENCYGEVVVGQTDPQGIAFVDHSSDILVRRNCSFCCIGNGIVVSDNQVGLVDDNFVQGNNLTFGNASVWIRGQSDSITVTNNQANGFFTISENVPPGTFIGPPTNLIPVGMDATHLGSNTIITVASSTTDTTARDAWLAAHPTNIGHF